jgi:flavorubredoxin
MVSTQVKEVGKVKVLVIYDTVSQARVTGKVAETVVAAMRESGASVDSFFVEDAGKANIKDYDCLVVGAPTMAWRPSTRMKDFLANLKGTDYSGKMAASFDTQAKSAFSGNATKHMDKDLTALGFKIALPALISYVESKNKVYRLKEGELEKAKAWGQELIKRSSK